MPPARSFSDIRLVNGSTGDPVLFVDYPGKHDAFLFDCGDLCALPRPRLADVRAVFLTHHHLDHFCGFDQVLRANLDHDKTVHLFGPEGTITKVHQRITSYELQYFPFMQLTIIAHEVLPAATRQAALCCAERFPEPHVAEHKRRGRVVYEDDAYKIEAVPVEHTAPCLAYALIEKPGFHPDRDKLNTGPLRPGPWIDQALAALRQAQPDETLLDIQGGGFRLGALAEQYFVRTRGSRIAFVTDTVWSDATAPVLTKLAAKAQRLYCDSYYSIAELKQAQQHKHMTARHAGELATRAKVDELILMHFAPRYAGRYQELIDEAKEAFPRVSAIC